MKLYITFGFEHRHEIGGQVFDKDCVALIERPTYAEARDRAFALFGPKFCFDHLHNPPDMSYFPRGIIDTAKRKNPAGRPQTLPGAKRVQILLQPEHIQAAQALGNGNISEGIRLALRMAQSA